MTTHSTTGLRVLAFLGGLGFLGGTVILVFGEVFRGAPIADKHLLSAIVICGAILAGHLYNGARGLIDKAKFGAIFLACTALVVAMSLGRQGETMAWTQAQADANEDSRSIARDGLKKANAMLAEAQDKLAKECASGKGKRCDGIRSTIAVYEAAATGHQATLDKVGPPKLVAPVEEQIANVAATFFGVNKDRTKAGAIMLMPFLIAAVCEFGVIFFFGFAFRGEPRKIIPLVETVSKPANDTQLPTSDAEIEKLRAFFVAGDGPVTNDQLAGRMGVSKAEASGSQKQ